MTFSKCWSLIFQRLCGWASTASGTWRVCRRRRVYRGRSQSKSCRTFISTTSTTSGFTSTIKSHVIALFFSQFYLNLCYYGIFHQDILAAVSVEAPEFIEVTWGKISEKFQSKPATETEANVCTSNLSVPLHAHRNRLRRFVVSVAAVVVDVCLITALSVDLIVLEIGVQNWRQIFYYSS